MHNYSANKAKIHRASHLFFRIKNNKQLQSKGLHWKKVNILPSRSIHSDQSKKNPLVKHDHFCAQLHFSVNTNTH